MSENLVIANKDNRVTYVFGGVDLTLATDIKVKFGDEEYTLLLDPTIVFVDSETELSLNLSATLEVGKIFSTVTYFDSASVNGTDITSRELANSDQIIVAIGTQLVIEDGSIVDNSNSFVTDEEYKAYSSLRGFKTPSNQPEREALLIQAMDYLFSKESSMKGCRVSSNQSLPYPRFSVFYNGFNVGSSVIPESLKKAQIELAIQANESSLLKTGTVQNLASFDVSGVYSESYFSGGNWEVVRTERADAYLSPLLTNSGSKNIMVRV